MLRTTSRHVDRDQKRIDKTNRRRDRDEQLLNLTSQQVEVDSQHVSLDSQPLFMTKKRLGRLSRRTCAAGASSGHENGQPRESGPWSDLRPPDKCSKFPTNKESVAILLARNPRSRPGCRC